MLDLSSFKKAIKSLNSAVTAAQTDAFMAQLTLEQQSIIKAGVIQNFEFSYELSWKFMKRWLSENVGRVYVDGISRRALYRLAAEYRLIDDVTAWWEYHSARNRSSHIYDEDIAEEVFQTALKFLPDATRLWDALEARND